VKFNGVPSVGRVFSIGTLNVVQPPNPILFGNSSTSPTAAGTILFNGATLLGVPNVIISNTGGQPLTVKPNLPGGAAMAVSLGTTNSTIISGANSPITISAPIGE